MKLFISYARIDKPYCVQLVNTLDVHQVWYDQRLYAGQQWWKEILRRLDWSEGFIYLLSPESVRSEYCLKELQIALQLQRPIIPVLIHADTQIPEMISDLQYVDISKGLTINNIKILLNSLYLAEQQVHSQNGSAPKMQSLEFEKQEPPVKNSAKVIGMAASALEDGQYDRAVFLLKQAKQTGVTSRFINLEKLLQEAEVALEEQSRERDAKREYEQIYQLFQYKRTRDIALEAFSEYQKIYPHYDPLKLQQYVGMEKVTTQVINTVAPPHEQEALPFLHWCSISGGVVTVEAHDYRDDIVRVEDFWMAKYPVTNEQFEIFINDPDGYGNEQWWSYNDNALAWFQSHKEPLQPHFKGAMRPRETVNWYEAMAFCNWLSHKVNATITLPTLAQWQRAALGDDEFQYPWGNDFSSDYCNTREAELKMTTPVTRYTAGGSVFGVYDLAGNVWEWTLNRAAPDDEDEERKCAVIGGSFVSPCDRAQPSFRYFLKPEARYSSIGFRIAMLPPSAHYPTHLR